MPIQVRFRRELLKKIKKIVSEKGFTLAYRDKNIGFMREHLLNEEDIKETIYDLSPNDCIGGPEEDRGGYEGHVLEFKSQYLSDLIIYIKVRYKPPEEVVVISFHEDEKI